MGAHLSTQWRDSINADRACSVCRTTKPAVEFEACGRGLRWRRRECRQCVGVRQKRNSKPQTGRYRSAAMQQWLAIPATVARMKASQRRYKRSPRGRASDSISHIKRRRALSGAGSLALREWLQILEAHHYQCAYCGSLGRLTIDHVVPIVVGGLHCSDNVVPACLRCNTSKGDRPWPIRFGPRAGEVWFWTGKHRIAATRGAGVSLASSGLPLGEGERGQPVDASL